MEYVQERIATLHDFDGAAPPAPTDRAAVVVPMTGRDHASLAAERVLSRLATVDPARVYVALRAAPDEAGEVAAWVDSFDLDAEVLWCNAPAVEQRLAEAGLPGDPTSTAAAESGDAASPAEGEVAPSPGKGRDVWLALGVAAAHDYVAVHDADASNYAATQVPKLLFGLDRGFEFVKGYYARVENGQLYGRLFRLFVRPLLRAIDAETDHPLVDYLLAFRYALAGEFAATSELVRSLRVPPGWGLEVGTLGDAYRIAGFDGTAQVDLGTHEHEHRAVGGPEGLGDMAREVGAALAHALADHGAAVDVDDVRAGYVDAAERAIAAYEADAAFNALDYDRAAEREQVLAYADALAAPDADHRLPAWRDCGLDPEDLRAVALSALADVRDR